MINPIPDRLSKALELPAMYCFVDSELRCDFLKAVDESINTRVAMADQFKQVRNDQSQGPEVSSITVVKQLIS